MRKFSLFAGMALVAVAAGVSLRVREAQARQSFSIGPATEGRSNNDYIHVCNDQAYDFNSGAVLVFTSGSQANGVSVATTTTYGDKLVAGVVPSSASLTAGTCGIIQVYGYHSAVLVASNTSAGSPLVTSATGRNAATYQVRAATITVDAQGSLEYGVATSTSVSNGLFVFGKALDATTSSTTVRAWISVR